ncbi:MAG TPA: hypothetical protein VFF81_00705 [Noviherbaspirillum sp.]|nr:hypothetical protein [Noviherbaspirillum sp.]
MDAENRCRAVLPMKLDAALAEVMQCPKQTRKEEKGNLLTLDDLETQLVNSSPLGTVRLAAMRALDIREFCPEISDEMANQIGVGYVVLRHLGRQGLLTESTRAENARLAAMRDHFRDISFESEDHNRECSKLECTIATDMYGEPLTNYCIDESVSPKQMDKLEQYSGARDIE